MGKQWKQCQALFLGAPKSLQMVTAAMKLKDAYSLEGRFIFTIFSIPHIGDVICCLSFSDFTDKGPSSQGYGFSCGHVWT